MVPTLFKSYDIRGRVPEELDVSVAKRIGKSLAALYQPKRVLVGRDMRTSSVELEQALIEGLVMSGVSVTTIGLCSTPMFNFAVGDAGNAYDLGVMVTASHNPPAYNGFKLVRQSAVPIGQGSGMETLRDLAASEQPLLESVQKGQVDQDDSVLDRYIRKIANLAALPETMPTCKIAIDAGNGMDGLVLPSVTKRLPDSLIARLYWELDGTFPHHEANPLKIETLADIQYLIRHDECDFGVAFDGDGDRVGFLDETGAPIPGDLVTALLARELLRDHPGSIVLYDLRSSWSVPEVIQESGGIPTMCRVGHAHVKHLMKETGALFAGELSLHFYFRDLWNCESGDLAFYLITKLLAREQKLLSAIWHPLQRYAHSGEINFSVRQASEILECLEQHYRPSGATDISRLDGLRMEWRRGQPDDWWFNVRASNTEPLIRLNLEARTPALMEERKQELSRLITAEDY